MKAATGLYIEDVRRNVVEFNEKFKEAVMIEYDRFKIHLEEVDMDEITKEYESNMQLLDVLTGFSDEDMATHLEGFREKSEGNVGNVESLINTAIMTDWLAIKS